MQHNRGFDSATPFFGVGAQKGGTTWLGDFLASHEDVLFSPLKELHFFDQINLENFREPVRRRFIREHRQACLAEPPDAKLIEALEERNRMTSLTDYRAFFSRRWQGQSHFGEITPSYALLDAGAFAVMQDAFPQARFFFIMRNPVDRVWSQLRMLEKVSKGKERAMERIHATRDDWMIWGRTDYGRTIDALQAVVPAARLHLMYYEQLFAPDGQTVLDSFCAFLGVHPRKGNFKKIINAGTEKQLPADAHDQLAGYLLPIYRDMHKRTGGNLPEAWLASMERAAAG